MSYLLKSNRKRNTKNPFLVSAIFVVSVFFLYIIFPNLLPKISYFFASPVWKVESFIVKKFDGFFGFFRTKNSLLYENELYKAELEDAHNRLLALDILEKENADLKEVIGRKINKEEITAFILSRPPRTAYDTLILDLGNNAGVKEGNNILVSGTIWLGKISKIYGDTSVATLLSAPDSKHELNILRGNTPVTVFGTGNGNFRAEVPRGVSVSVGDVLVPPGLKEMIVAKIYDIELNPEDSFQKIYARAPLNIQNISSVDIDIKDILKIDEKILQAEKASTTKNVNTKKK